MYCPEPGVMHPHSDEQVQLVRPAKGIRPASSGLPRCRSCRWHRPNAPPRPIRQRSPLPSESDRLPEQGFTDDDVPSCPCERRIRLRPADLAQRGPRPSAGPRPISRRNERLPAETGIYGQEDDHIDCLCYFFHLLVGIGLRKNLV